LGLALVAGKKRVPKPATGKTALVTALVDKGMWIPIAFTLDALIVQQASHGFVQILQAVVFLGPQPQLGREPQSFRYPILHVL
jgi:hypothetical protein